MEKLEYGIESDGGWVSKNSRRRRTYRVVEIEAVPIRSSKKRRGSRIDAFRIESSCYQRAHIFCLSSAATIQRGPLHQKSIH